MTIVVTTPTGHVGTRVVRLLVQAGVRPTVLVRNPSTLDPGMRALVDVRRGDLRDADFIRASTVGADALFLVDPTAFRADDPNAVSAQLGADVAAAVVANRVPRVVFQSSVGAEKRHGAGLIDGLARIEEQLDQTGAGVLHLRCGYFFVNLLGSVEALRTGVLTTTWSPEATMPWVDPRDVGEIVVARLLGPGWSGPAVQAVHGPEDLSFGRVAEILTRATGQPITLAVETDEEQRRGLIAAGLSERAAAGVVGMTSGLRDVVPEQARSVLTTTPTTLGEWAHAVLRPLLTPGR